MNADEQAIRDLRALWHRTTKAGNVDTVVRLMADDVVFLAAGLPPMHGRGAFESGLRNLLTRCRIESAGKIALSILRRELGDSWVVARDATMLAEAS